MTAADRCICTQSVGPGKLSPHCPVHGPLLTRSGTAPAPPAGPSAHADLVRRRTAHDMGLTLDGLTLLGRALGGTPASITADQIETFQRPEHVQRVTMTSDEFTAVCPVTGQPDQYVVRIEYGPRGRCLESKALKLYLQRFRNEGVFCEALAGRIAAELGEVTDAAYVHVTLTQKARGGISIQAEAVFARRDGESGSASGPPDG